MKQHRNLARRRRAVPINRSLLTPAVGSATEDKGEMDRRSIIRRKIAAALLAAAFAVSVPAAALAQSDEGPGNGGGQSGQCTGSQDDRPASCKSRGGPGDRGSN
jgi:uncharacterized membrane protein